MENSQDFFSTFCRKHKQSSYQFISLAKGKSQQRLLCSQCLLPENKINNIADLIPISIALSQPETLIDWIKKDSFSKWLKKTYEFSIINLEKKFKEQISLLEQVKEIIDDAKIELQRQLKIHQIFQTKFKELRKNYFEVSSYFYQKIKYSEFCEQFKQLMEGEKRSAQCTEIIIKISKLIEGMIKDTTKVKEFQEAILEHRILSADLQNIRIGELYKLINIIFQSYESLRTQLNFAPFSNIYEVPKFKIMNLEFFKTIELKIQNDSKKILTQMNLVYLGQRDGLNAEQFWKRVDGKDNLLMIFQSKNEGNQIFGGYTPCKWQANLSNYLSDDSQTSFLFSQSHGQIYPLREDKKTFAIYCYQGYGPTFGGGCDMYVAADFISGYSNLGLAYEWNQLEGQNEHLFGGIQPNIAECEVYGLILE